MIFTGIDTIKKHIEDAQAAAVYAVKIGKIALKPGMETIDAIRIAAAAAEVGVLKIIEILTPREMEIITAEGKEPEGTLEL